MIIFVKPFALSELLARLRALIRRSVGMADPVIRIGDVAIDTWARPSPGTASTCPSRPANMPSSSCWPSTAASSSRAP